MKYHRLACWLFSVAYDSFETNFCHPVVQGEIPFGVLFGVPRLWI